MGKNERIVGLTPHLLYVLMESKIEFTLFARGCNGMTVKFEGMRLLLKCMRMSGEIFWEDANIRINDFLENYVILDSDLILGHDGLLYPVHKAEK